MGFIRCDEGGNPPCLFDFIQRDEEGRPSPSCPFDVLRCDKAPNTRSVPIWAYSWCSCPDGHVLRVWCCLQHRAPETRPFRCFLVLGSFPIPGIFAALPPLPCGVHFN